jgi:bacillopeptidase F (M6 metalloprotease family)
MKTKITIQNFATAVFALLLLSGFNAKAQTHVYNDAAASGIFIDGGSEVANPLSGDAVNSSATCAQSGTGWQKIEFFPTYTPVSGDKLYFSVYNPNSVTAAQIKFNYTSGTTEVWGGNVTYEAGATSGWLEHSLDLTDHVGTEINKILLYLAGGEANSAYVDNVYFSTSSVLSINSVAKINNRLFISKEGKIQFNKEQANTQLSVFDVTGRLILKENINGKNGEKVLPKNGIYILRINSVHGVSSQKIAFY